MTPINPETDNVIPFTRTELSLPNFVVRGYGVNTRSPIYTVERRTPSGSRGKLFQSGSGDNALYRMREIAINAQNELDGEI